MLSSGVVILFVESEFTSSSERRFDKALTIHQLKWKLETITGIPPSHQILRILSSSSKSSDAADDCIELLSDDAILSSYPIENYMTLNVRSISSSKQSQAAIDSFSDLSEIQKYEMPDEQYDKRTDSVRHFKKVHKLGRYSDNKQLNSVNPDIQVGKRCQVFGQNGTVRFVGSVKNVGHRIGIELDEPMGEHDGEYKSFRYFEAKPKSGLFALASDVIIGDFKVVDVLEELEEL